MQSNEGESCRDNPPLQDSLQLVIARVSLVPLPLPLHMTSSSFLVRAIDIDFPRVQKHLHHLHIVIINTIKKWAPAILIGGVMLFLASSDLSGLGVS